MGGGNLIFLLGFQRIFFYTMYEELIFVFLTRSWISSETFRGKNCKPATF